MANLHLQLQVDFFLREVGMRMIVAEVEGLEMAKVDKFNLTGKSFAPFRHAGNDPFSVPVVNVKDMEFWDSVWGP